MSSVDSLLGVSDFVLKKKILSVREHYDLEDRTGTKLGEADGNLFQFPARALLGQHLYGYSMNLTSFHEI